MNSQLFQVYWNVNEMKCINVNVMTRCEGSRWPVVSTCPKRVRGRRTVRPSRAASSCARCGASRSVSHGRPKRPTRSRSTRTRSPGPPSTRTPPRTPARRRCVRVPNADRSSTDASSRRRRTRRCDRSTCSVDSTAAAAAAPPPLLPALFPVPVPVPRPVRFCSVRRIDRRSLKPRLRAVCRICAIWYAKSKDPLPPLKVNLYYYIPSTFHLYISFIFHKIR